MLLSIAVLGGGKSSPEGLGASDFIAEVDYDSQSTASSSSLYSSEVSWHFLSLIINIA